MRYKYSLGQFIVCLDDVYNLIKTSVRFFDVFEGGTYNLLCKVDKLSNLSEIPKGILNVRDKMVEGQLRNYFFSALVNRRIVIVTNIVEGSTTVYAEEDSINDYSIYSMYVSLKKHIASILCKDGNYMVLHGATVFNPVNREAILVVGESGCGKSSISWYLINQFGYQLLSDDLTVYDIRNGKIEGEGGNLFVTEDFVERFQIPKYDIVCPGRKMRIFVKSCREKGLPITKVFIASGVSDQRSELIREGCIRAEKMIASQIGWFMYEKNKLKYQQIIEKIADEVEMYNVFLNSRLLDCLKQIVGEL